MINQKTYVGIDNDSNAGMTPTANIVRDAWVFGILPETETCEGWTIDRVQMIYDKVAEAWQPYGHMVSRLPSDLRERHQRIYDAAIKRARELGWEAPGEDDD